MSWAAKWASSSSAIRQPRPPARTSRVPITAVETTGTPRAMDSSRTSPWVSVREAKTKASPAL